jgi:hypothetical protein
MCRRRELPPIDGEAFVAKLEEAQAEQNADFVGLNVGRPDRLTQLKHWQGYEIAQLEYRSSLPKNARGRPGGRLTRGH